MLLKIKKPICWFKKLSKRVLFLIILGIFFVGAGVFTIVAVNNRGNEPVAWWRLDEGYGTSAYDASANSNTGTIINAVWKNEPYCKTGKCLYFDGTNDYLSIINDSTLNPTEGVTIETWARPNNFDSSASLIKKDQQYSLDIAQGVPNFRAYANSRWYSAIGGERAWLFREPADNQLTGDGGATFTEAFGYRALTPANLTAEKGVLITDADGSGSGSGDNLQYSRGSQSTPDGTNVVYENFDPNQGTLEFWVRPNWDGDDGLRHYITQGWHDTNNRFQIRKDISTNDLYFSYYANSSGADVGAYDISSWNAGVWHHIIGVWDKNNVTNGTDNITLYVDGSRIAGNVTDPGQAEGVDTDFHIGSGRDGADQFNGTIAGRILNRPLTSTEVTALYNSGAGSTDTFTVTPDTVWMGTYSDDSTTATYWHTGKSVSAIADGANEDTLTTASGADNSFSDNDRVVVYDGTGYKVEGCVDGAPSDTSVAVDNCADADPGTTENIGVHAELDSSTPEYFYNAAASMKPGDGVDFYVAAWVNPAVVGTYIIFQSGLPYAWVDRAGYYFYMSGDKIGIRLDDETDTGGGAFTSEACIVADKWQHIAVRVDRDDLAYFFCNGYAAGTANVSGYDGDLSDAAITRIGTGYNGAGNPQYSFDGKIRDVRIQVGGTQPSDAQILYQATHPLDYTASSWTLNGSRGYYTMTDSDMSSGLTASGDAIALLTAGGGNPREQEAFVSKNLIQDGSMENGGIGEWQVGDVATTLAKDTTTIKYDNQSLKITNADASQAFARQSITTVAGEDYYFNGWFYGPSTVNGASQLVDVDATAALGVTATQAGAIASTWKEVDFCFEAGDTSTDIDLGSGSVIDTEIGYWDSVKLLPNLIDDGGMEGAYTSCGASLTLSSVNTTFTSTRVTDGSAWTLSSVISGYIAIASGGSKGMITVVDDGSDYVDVENWDAGTPSNGETVRIYYALPDGWSTSICNSASKPRRLEGRTGSYAQQLRMGAASCTHYLYQDIAGYEDFKGKYLTLSAWVNGNWSIGAGSCTPPYIMIDDGVSTVSSETKSVDDGWEKLIITKLISDSATKIRVRLYVPYYIYSTWDDISLVVLDDISPSTATPSTEANSFGTGKWSDTNGAFLVDGGDTLTYTQSGNLDNEAGTVAFWVKPNGYDESTPVDKYWIDTRDSTPDQGFYVYMNSTEDDVVFAGNDSVNVWAATSTAIDWSVNAWHHIAVTYDCSQAGGSDEVYLYIDGSVAASDTSETCASWTLPTNMYVNSDYAGANQGDAYLDDIRTYDSVLSSTEITDIYNNTKLRTVSANEWAHLTGVYSKDDANLKIYKNGVLQNTVAVGASYDLATSSNNLMLGEAFFGFLDEPRIYDYARTADQVKADYVAASSLRGASGRAVTVGEGIDSSEGLVAHWAMDESAWDGTTDEVVDSSGNANHGVRVADANTTSTAKYGRAGTFDGTGDYVDIGIGPTAVNVVAFWANPGTTSDYFIDLNGSAYISVSSGTLSATGFTDPTIYVNGAVSNTIVASAWQHIVVTTNTSINASDLDIGRLEGTDDYQGEIDDVKMYSVIRSASQIRKDYETGPPPDLHLKMDENTGDTVYDTAGENDGILGTGSGVDVRDPSWAPGKYGSGLKLDGYDDRIIVSHGSAFEFGRGNFTIAFWAKIIDNIRMGKDYYYGESPAGENRWAIHSAGYGQGIMWQSANCGDGSNDVMVGAGSSGDYADGEWRHFAFVKKDQIGYWYINSVDKTSWRSDSFADFGCSLSNDRTLVMGRYTRYPVDGTDYMDGSFDDFRVYKYARTQKQIMEDMNAGHPAVGSPVGSYVGYWKFDEGYGTTAYDNSVNDNDLTLSNESWETDCKFDSCWDGDGTEYVYRNDDPDFDFGATDDFAITGWFKHDTIADNPDYLVVKNNGKGYKIYMDSDGDLAFGIDDDASFDPDDVVGDDQSKNYDDNTWHHFAAIANDTTSIKLYVDGIKIDEDTTIEASGTLANADPLYIGVDDDGSSNPWDGEIDELKIYRFTLTPEEIKQEYNQSKSLVLGSKSTESDGTTPSNSASREYCVPGDTTFCDPPVAHWRMDTKGGDTAYDLAGSNDGTLGSGAGADSADPVWRHEDRCHEAGCLDFDGVDDYVDAGNDDSLTNISELTISAWINSPLLFEESAGSDLGSIVDNDDNENYQMRVNEDGQVILNLGGAWNACRTAGGAITANTWHHLVGTYDGSNCEIFVDGISKDTGTGGALIDSAEPVYIGKRKDTATERFNGIIDDVRIYDYARTPAQIAWEYNRGAPVGWWKMDEGQDSETTCNATGSTVYDYSGNGNNGTLSLQPAGNTATTTAWSEGKYSCALDFDGTDDYVEIGDSDSLDNTNQLTISTWVYPESISNRGILAKRVAFQDNHSYDLYFASSKLYVDIDSNNDRFSSNKIFSTNQWYHIVVVYDGTLASAQRAKVYVDGVLDKTATETSTSIPNYASNFYIGVLKTDPGTTWEFDGLIDDVRIYNYALTPLQIRTLYNENSAVRFGPTEGLP